MTDENTDEVAQNMDRNTIIEGLKPHESILRVVVHDVLKDTIDLTDPQIIESLIAASHCINSDAITDITPLGTYSTRADHYSIIMSRKYPEDLNTWIQTGVSTAFRLLRLQLFFRSWLRQLSSIFLLSRYYF
jgi:hypothetical protein